MTEECTEASTEDYEYKVGDTGYLVNGEDTYRILATDMVVRPIGYTEITIHALVINNSHDDDGTNIFEQAADFSAKGWSMGHALAGSLGNDFYDLTPPVEG